MQRIPRWTAEPVRQDASESLFQRFQSLRRRSPFTDSGTFRGVCPVSPMVRGVCPVSPMVKENIGDRVLKRLEQEKVMPSGV